MTYRSLIDKLSRIPNIRLDDDVTVLCGDEVFKANFRVVKETDTDIGDVLDDGHVVLQARMLD